MKKQDSLLSKKMRKKGYSPSVLDVMKDDQFEKYLGQALTTALNPPASPKGLKYKEEPWERLKRFHIDTPAAILREHGLIMANRSMERQEMKAFITSIVQGAVTATIMHYQRPGLIKRIIARIKRLRLRF